MVQQLVCCAGGAGQKSAEAATKPAAANDHCRLRRECPEGFSADNIPEKVQLLSGERWEKECKAPLGNASLRVKYPDPDRMTIIRVIEDYLERRELYLRLIAEHSKTTAKGR